MNIALLQDLAAISTEAAKLFSTLSEQHIGEKGRFTVALSGGSTPRGFYNKLTSEPHRNSIRWNVIHFFQADERFVPRSHVDSNYRLLHEFLFRHVAIPAENIHSIPVQKQTASEAAFEYEHDIRQFFRLDSGSLPELDLIVLGIGEDGHTASLFPGSDVLDETHRLVVPVTDLRHRHTRITLTIPVLNRAGHVIFLVSGTRKSHVARRVYRDKDASLPASLVQPEKGTCMLLIDQEAAQYL